MFRRYPDVPDLIFTGQHANISLLVLHHSKLLRDILVFH